MSIKEKAIDLYNKFYNTSTHQHHIETRQRFAIHCALIAVDEIIESNIDFDHDDNIWCDTGRYRNATIYWGKVKEEIEKL